MKDVFLQLVRSGLGLKQAWYLPDIINWEEIRAISIGAGLYAIVLDGIENMPSRHRPQQKFLLNWIGEVLQIESVVATQQKAAVEMSLLFKGNDIRTYVLKGAVIAECYPNPKHRNSVDMDCFLLPVQGNQDAWSLGNDLIKAQGYEVSINYYKNSTFHLPGLAVENHRYFTPFRGNKRLKSLEKVFQSLMKEDKENNRFDGTWLCRPPVIVTALFMIEHAYSHFLHEGLTWRLVLDWMMFSNKHSGEINEDVFDAMIDKYNFRKFYNSFSCLGHYLLGSIDESDLTREDMLMLNDIWSPLDLHESLHGVKGKLALVGNTWRARWKYHYFADNSMLNALWILVKGYLFMKNPQLD